MTNIVDFLDDRITLTDSLIDLEEYLSEYFSEHIEELSDDNSSFDESEYRKRNIEILQERLSCYYGIRIVPEDGFNALTVVTDDDQYKIKRYLHRFLSYKSFQGGKNANSDGSAKLFENISANSVRNFLGGNSRIIMVGEGENRLAVDKIKEISAIMYEEIGCLINLPVQAKDDGVDFIVFKTFDERNVGNLVVLGQACVGKHYACKKPIKKRWKSDYIHFAVQPPVTLLSTVYFLDKNSLKRIHSEFDDAIIFDRGRIMKYFDVNDSDLNERIIQFVNEKIDSNI